MAKVQNHDTFDSIVSEDSATDASNGKKRARTLTAGLTGIRVSVEPDVASSFNELAKNRKVSTGFLFEMLYDVFINATPETRKEAYQNVSNRKKQSAWEE